MNKLETINKIFEGYEIRSIWDSEKEEYYFSIVDVIGALTDSADSRKYWSVLKTRLKKEGSELTTKCSQLKMKAKDGKFYNTDVLDTEGIFRLIESVPSKKAEPLKLWLAKLGRQEIDNVFDPSKGIAEHFQRGGQIIIHKPTNLGSLTGLLCHGAENFMGGVINFLDVPGKFGIGNSIVFFPDFFQHFQPFFNHAVHSGIPCFFNRLLRCQGFS